MSKSNHHIKSLGIIMDGNRRWAKEQGLMSVLGHKAGYEKLKEFLRWAGEEKIEYVIAYAFSTENWKRDTSEVSYLMNLLTFALSTELAVLTKENVRVRCIGDRSRLDTAMQDLMTRAEEVTKENKGLCLVFAISYGGRAEIIEGIKRISREKSKEEIENLSEEDFGNALWTAGVPDPDLIIRTSGEMRLSNFLLWQSVYSELFFTPTYWPALTQEEFKNIITEFYARTRRLGK